MTQNFQQPQTQAPAPAAETQSSSPFVMDEVQIPNNPEVSVGVPIGSGWQQQYQVPPQPQSPAPQQQVDGFTPGQMQQLEAMLAKLAPAQPAGTGTPPSPYTPVNAVTNQPVVEQAPASTPGLDELSAQFKQVLGVDLKEAVQQIQQVQAHQVMEQTHQQLRDHWNLDQRGLTQRYQQIAQAATNVPPEQVAKYDALGADGVILFYERYVAPNTPKKTPVFDRGTSFVPRGNESFDVNKARAAIASGDVSNNWGDILAAYSQQQN